MRRWSFGAGGWHFRSGMTSTKTGSSESVSMMVRVTGGVLSGRRVRRSPRQKGRRASPAEDGSGEPREAQDNAAGKAEVVQEAAGLAAVRDAHEPEPMLASMPCQLA